MICRQREVYDHMRRARQIARAMARSRPWCRDPDALYGAALLGLAEAIAHTDGDRSPHEFLRYSYLRMVGAVLDELRDQDVANREERDVWAGNVRVRQNASQAFIDRVSREPRRTLLSLEQLMDRDNGNAWEPADPDDAAEVLELRDLWRRVEQELEERPRDRHVLGRSFFAEATLAQIGRELGITESGACQLRQAAICRLATLTTGLAKTSPAGMADG